MKKLFSIMAIAAFTVFALTGCQNSMESDAQDMADLGCQMMEIITTAQTNPQDVDTEKAEEIEKNIEKIQNELKEKYSEEEYNKVGQMAQKKMTESCGDAMAQ